MKRTIFFSWQFTSDRAVNADLIRRALETAERSLKSKYHIDDAADRNPGSPAIFDVIKAKICSCLAFVADISLVIQYQPKLSCNPNVLVEYGFALAKLGPRRIILVMNRHFGPPDNLPFDVKQFEVVCYELAPGADSAALHEEEEKLSSDLLTKLRHTIEDPGSVLSLSDLEWQVAEHLLRTSNSGIGGIRGINCKVEDLATSVNLTLQDTREAIAELESREYVGRLPVAAPSPPVFPTDLLFWDLDRLVHGWDPREDARLIAKALVETSGSGDGSLDVKRYCQQQKWDWRRVNPALTYLDLGKCAESDGNRDPNVYSSHLSENSHTRAFLSGRWDPEVRRGE